jgi:hypothetical protein
MVAQRSGLTNSGAILCAAAMRPLDCAPSEGIEMLRRHKALTIGAALVLAASGCATTGRVSELEKRVDELESRMTATDQKAQQALDTAENAERTADDAARLATDSARTAEAIFKKSVHK